MMTVSNLKDRKYYILVFLFWVALFLLPRAFFWEESPGTLSKMRFEDLLAPLWIIYLLTRKNELFKIFGLRILGFLCAWGTFVFLFTFVNSIFRGYPILVGFVFAGKELQYILYMSFFAVFAARNTGPVIKVVLIPAILSLVYPLWELCSGEYTGYYGTKFSLEEGIYASSEIGAISAISLLCYFSIMLNKKQLVPYMHKWLRVGIYPLSGIGLLVLASTVSKSSIIAGGVTIVVITFVKALRSRLNPLYLLFPIIIITISFFILQQLPIYEAVEDRFTSLIYYGFPDREESWKGLLNSQVRYFSYDPWAILTGLGLGSPNFLYFEGKSGFSLCTDSQYVRRLFEVGALGSLLWVGLLACIGIRIIKNVKGTQYYSVFSDLVLGIFMTVSIISVGLEVLQLIRVASIFYALMGILLGISFVASKQAIYENRSL